MGGDEKKDLKDNAVGESPSETLISETVHRESVENVLEAIGEIPFISKAAFTFDLCEWDSGAYRDL